MPTAASLAPKSGTLNAMTTSKPHRSAVHPSAPIVARLWTEWRKRSTTSSDAFEVERRNLQLVDELLDATEFCVPSLLPQDYEGSIRSWRPGELEPTGPPEASSHRNGSNRRPTLPLAT